MSQFSFPTLTIDEILDNWDFVKRSDYEKPECSRWFKIYALMFESITGVKLEVIEEKALLSFSKIIDVEQPEIYEEASRVIWFTIALQRSFMTCGVPDFTFKDIRDPRPKRLTMISSACINFLRYKSSRDSLVQEVLDKVETKKIQQNEILKNNEGLKKKLELALHIRAKKEPEMESLVKNSEETRDKIGTIQAESQEVLKAISERRAKTTEVRASKAQKNCELVKMKQDCEKLRQNIVQSPQKTKGKIKSAKERVEKMKEEIQSKMNNSLNYSNKLSHMKDWECMQEQTLCLLQAIEGDVQKLEEIKAEIEATMELSVANSMKLKAFQLEEDELVESQALIQERHQKLQTQKRVRITDFEARNSELVKQNKSLKGSLEKSLLQKEEMMNEQQMLVDNLKDTGSISNTRINIVIKNYSDILEELDKYHLFLKKNLALNL